MIHLEPGVSPHIYMKTHYPSYKYRNKSMDMNFILKEIPNRKPYKIVEHSNGEYYLFVGK